MRFMPGLQGSQGVGMAVDYADVLNLQTFHELAEATAGELTPMSRTSLRPPPRPLNAMARQLMIESLSDTFLE